MNAEHIEKLLRDELARTHFPLVRLRDVRNGQVLDANRYRRLPVAGDELILEGDRVARTVRRVRQFPVDPKFPELGGVDVFVNATRVSAGQEQASSKTPYVVGGVLAVLALAGAAYYFGTREGAPSTPGATPQAQPPGVPQALAQATPQGSLAFTPGASPPSTLNQAILNQIQAGTAKAATGITPIKILFGDGSYELISADGSAVSHQANGTVIQSWPAGSYTNFPQFVSQIRTLESKSTGTIEHALTHPLPTASQNVPVHPSASTPPGASAPSTAGLAGLAQGIAGQVPGAISAIQSGNFGQLAGTATQALGSVPGLGGLGGMLGSSGLGGGGLGGVANAAGLGNVFGGSGGGGGDSSGGGLGGGDSGGGGDGT